MKFAELKSPDIARMDKADKVVLVPLGSIEQHGPHCPVMVDSLLGSELAARVEATLPETVLLTPTLWLGSSDHHLTSPGTISVPSALYIEMVSHVCESLLSAGFRRVFLFLSHGGNDVPCQEVIYRLGLKYRERRNFWIASAGWWSLADDVMRLPEMETERSSHACEYETSMVLALRPELVEMSAARGGRVGLESRFCILDPTSGKASKVRVSLPMEHMTETGALGRPDLATPEKGQRLLDTISERVAEFVREFATWPLPQKGQP
ncbi:MAG: creatininase family protein [Planctomycetaceae bacterium]|nr:creatininase family protein [Planctomycetaceae bacterium]